ncbi:hypothetical protein MN116_007736 [Schistosoma mekongi]|uniref:Biogenesis of lysosome-related organelles complex 1 subunit 2 n=1 Tax=Schistosoma mekongi TaxID=38744 RepID=A0AAE1Z7Y0_SCHME|nr:hypothetical protein MN116_007736 [Schistosoma mekongi]
MEENLQEKKNNLIETSEQSIDQINSPVDENSLLISRTTKAVRDYLEYDFECLLSDINVLTRMNQASTERYMEITTSTNDMTRKLVDINNRFISLGDALKKIDQFDKDIEQLEQKALEIETLTKQLGWRLTGTRMSEVVEMDPRNFYEASISSEGTQYVSSNYILTELSSFVL